MSYGKELVKTSISFYGYIPKELETHYLYEPVRKQLFAGVSSIWPY